MLPQEIMGLPGDRQLQFAKFVPPVVAEKVRYWDVSHWRDRAEPNPMEGDHPRNGMPHVNLRRSRKGGSHG